MLVIYHSCGRLPARQAAAIHLGVELTAVPEGDGLVLVKLAGDGHRVAALTGVAPHGVVVRAYASVTAAFDLPPGGYLLQEVGPPSRWPERWAVLLTVLGLGGLARRFLTGRLEREARKAVARVHQRLRSPQGGAVQ